MRYLLIGDPHGKREDLDDLKQLAGLVIKTASVEKPDRIVWLGDQNHHHSIVHVEVMDFWFKFFTQLKDKTFDQIALVGNHDQAGNGDPLCHSMVPYSGILKVVDKPYVIDGILFCPYMEDNQSFVDVCRAHPQSLAVICHQTFDGSQFENGFYAKEGIDQNLLPQKHVISGHIHTPQEIGRVWYPGAPRWQTVSDANVARAIWLVEFDDAGNVMSKKGFDTGVVCRQIKHLRDTPDHPVDSQDLGNARVLLDIVGPSEWVDRRKKELRRSGVEIRTFRTDTKKVEIRESEGISSAFAKFFDAYQPKLGTDKLVLKEMLRSRLA